MVRPGANRVVRKGWLGASYPPAQYASLYNIFCPLRQRVPGPIPANDLSVTVGYYFQTA
jgi:hypothetical protein